MKDIDYSKYKLEELYDVRDNIDAESYPERFKDVLEEIENQEKLQVKNNESELKTDFSKDPVSKITRWEPLKNGGANFLTHSLRELNASRYEFETTLGAKLFSLFFIIMGGGAAVVFLTNAIEDGRVGLNIETILPALAGGAFVLVGIGLYFYLTTPIVFDKNKQMFWKSRNSPKGYDLTSAEQKSIKLSEIYALQLLEEMVDDCLSYELNLVLKNGERRNVIDHGDLIELRQDAQKLSLFLSVPVWDAINE